MSTILPKDSELVFPNFVLVSASAGSGKTHAITLRLLQLLISAYVPNRAMNNILAITFTKNAAAEMKNRLIETLKKVYFDIDAGKTINELKEIISYDKQLMQNNAEILIDAILDNYSDLHIQTIDSFLAKVLKSSALEFGITPQADIVLNAKELINEAFELLINNLTQTKEGRKLLDRLIDLVSENNKDESSFVWNPYVKLRDEVGTLFTELMTYAGDLVTVEDRSDELLQIKNDIKSKLQKLKKLVDKSGFEPQQWFVKLINALDENDYESIIKSNFTRELIKKTGNKISGSKDTYESWSTKFKDTLLKLNELTSNYILIKSQLYYKPYIDIYFLLQDNLEKIKVREGKMSISEICKKLASCITAEMVPEIYFNLGENVFHYLIDEFQDTSPIQWVALQPLLENALSKDGSLFIVGDTKQSIFTFRGADWRIMRKLLEYQEFPSAKTNRINLEINYRSKENILLFNEEVFHRIIPEVTNDNSASASGLSIDYQKAKPEFKTKGYVEYISLDYDFSEPERSRLIEIINDCVKREHLYKEIAIITPKNADVVKVSGWLNEAGIEFISHSSLDVRTRKITGEIISLLKFLDSPIDDLSFANFIAGEVFQTILNHNSYNISTANIHRLLFESAELANNQQPLYAIFRSQYPELWQRYFSELYRLVGYLPIYDLVCVIYKAFNLFELLKHEEATLVKILEVINKFEEKGKNSLNDFLAYAGEDDAEGEWDIDIPADTNAVSIMTIHKAKGLGFQVVIVLLYDTRPKNSNLFVEENEDGIKLYRLSKEDAKKDTLLNNLYYSQRLREQVDELNKLYVALTRAKEEMYIISVKKPDRKGQPSCYLPQNGCVLGEKVFMEQKKEVKELISEVYHTSKIDIPRTSLESRLKIFERKRGDFIHEVLARITILEADVESQVRSIIKNIEDVPIGLIIESIVQVVTEILRIPEINEWFIEKKDRRILNEQDFVGSSGNLYRMDRVIIDKELVTVIDFKTGSEKNSYIDQINGYKKILSEIFSDRIIQGALIYIDKKSIQWIK